MRQYQVLFTQSFLTDADRRILYYIHASAAIYLKFVDREHIHLRAAVHRMHPDLFTRRIAGKQGIFKQFQNEGAVCHGDGFSAARGSNKNAARRAALADEICGTIIGINRDLTRSFQETLLPKHYARD